MRVLTTNSLLLAAISLASSVSAAPYTSAPDVDSIESYPNATALSRDSGPSSIPNVPRDADSLYDATLLGHSFKHVADLFSNIGMSSLPENMPNEVQKAFDQLHEALDTAAEIVPNPPLSPRSVEAGQVVGPSTPLDILSGLGGPVNNVEQLLSVFGINGNTAAPRVDVQNKVIDILRTALANGALDVTKLGVLPFNHARSVEEKPLQTIVSEINQALSRLAAAIAKVSGNAKDTVHIEHTREEDERLDHYDYNEPHGDDHSHDESQHDDEPKTAHDDDDDKSGDAQRDGGEPHDAHQDGHKSLEDRHVRVSNQGDRCRGPRDVQWDGRHKWDGCRYHDDQNGSDKDSLLRISLGHTLHRP